MKDTGHQDSGAARGEADVTRFWDDEASVNLLLIRPSGGLAASDIRTLRAIASVHSVHGDFNRAWL